MHLWVAVTVESAALRDPLHRGAEAVENAVRTADVHAGQWADVVPDDGCRDPRMAMTAKNMPYQNGVGPLHETIAG
ncbi:hypothetical protein ACFFX1_36865 [Dactylosporangium sucinum]|uniref:Uncharacterized protein n=1 Tax=Dactylosporangium sucinum TaxID=1424081 RepID=A0A917WWQ1_9ACTN|nr:hypothetical protein [Dactylosporangium sucinum]GGM36796.1 hypothetical protein GCM10007977_042850 [Dactylosporangium sucinum]